MADSCLSQMLARPWWQMLRWSPICVGDQASRSQAEPCRRDRALGAATQTSGCLLGAHSFVLVVVQSLSQARLFATPRTAAHQASLSFTISQSLFKLMSIESVMPSNHLSLCHPLLLPSVLPSIRVFSTSGTQSIGASASVLPRNIQG